MVPYLNAYLKLFSGCKSVEIFNGCRVKNNLQDRNKTSGEWELVPDGVWDGYCSTIWPTDGEDPWHDPYDPASGAVAGFLVDTPDSDGHGFYIEPSGSERIVNSVGLEPLEMFVTGSVVSRTAEGERYWLRWIDRVLRQCLCDDWGAVIYTHTPCAEDLADVDIDDSGIVFPEGWNVDQPERPDPWCETAQLLGETTPIVPRINTGLRTIPKLKYLGYERLEQCLYACSGNRYKFMFEVASHLWFGPPTALACVSADQWDKCNVWKTHNTGVCIHQPREKCGELTQPTIGAVTQPVLGTGAQILDTTLGGLIAVPGRYCRPDRVKVLSVLTANVGGGFKAPEFRITTDTDIKNLRLSVHRAYSNVQPPDTCEGFKYYNGIKPLWRRDIGEIKQGQTWCLNADGSVVIECVDGTLREGGGLVDGAAKPFDCPGRLWVVAEVSENQDTDFKVDTFLTDVETI